MLEVPVNEWQAARRVRALKMAAHLRKGTRRGVLKREDGLLLVADRKNGTLHAACPFARKKLFRQKTDDLPLPGAGVLRLVNQNMVNALVKLVMHPGSPLLAE